MSISIEHRVEAVPIVKHKECSDWQMRHITSIVELGRINHLYQCDICKNIEAVTE